MMTVTNAAEGSAGTNAFQSAITGIAGLFAALLTQGAETGVAATVATEQARVKAGTDVQVQETSDAVKATNKEEDANNLEALPSTKQNKDEDSQTAAALVATASALLQVTAVLPPIETPGTAADGAVGAAEAKPHVARPQAALAESIPGGAKQHELPLSSGAVAKVLHEIVDPPAHAEHSEGQEASSQKSPETAPKATNTGIAPASVSIENTAADAPQVQSAQENPTKDTNNHATMRKGIENAQLAPSGKTKASPASSEIAPRRSGEDSIAAPEAKHTIGAESMAPILLASNPAASPTQTGNTHTAETQAPLHLEASENKAVSPMAFHSERVAERMAGSELNFTVRLDDKAHVQVTTNLHERTIELGIVAERAETVSALKSEVPYLENHLRTHTLELGEVKVSLQDATAMNAGLSPGGQQSRHEWKSPVVPFAAEARTHVIDRNEEIAAQILVRAGEGLSLLA